MLACLQDIVEDTKGNPGEEGIYLLTNLRILWILRRDRRTNLSVGFDTIQNITIKSSESRLTGSIKSMLVLTKFNNSKFEFIFTGIAAPDNAFSTTVSVHHSYEATRFYRDLKLRSAVVSGGELMALPQVRPRVLASFSLF